MVWLFMRAASAPLAVTDGQRQILERLAGSQSVAHREVIRAQALLLAARGLANTAIGAQLLRGELFDVGEIGRASCRERVCYPV